MEKYHMLAAKELENLLESYPYLNSFQDEIERLLINSGSSERRMAVLHIMIEANLIELQKHLISLADIVDQTSIKIRDHGEEASLVRNEFNVQSISGPSSICEKIE